MKTAVHMGPTNQGRQLTLSEFMEGDYEEGYRYELIDGRLCVSPVPDPAHDIILEWIRLRLQLYMLDHPDVINYLSGAARLFPKRPAATCPQPDLAAFHDFPLHLAPRRIRWRHVEPVLVVEVASPDNADKDFERNVELYFQVPGIREYWILDIREDPGKPSLTVHRRRGGRWTRREFPHGATYTTRLLPGFVLTVDPRRPAALH